MNFWAHQKMNGLWNGPSSSTPCSPRDHHHNKSNNSSSRQAAGTQVHSDRQTRALYIQYLQMEFIVGKRQEKERWTFADFDAAGWSDLVKGCCRSVDADASGLLCKLLLLLNHHFTWHAPSSAIYLYQVTTATDVYSFRTYPLSRIDCTFLLTVRVLRSCCVAEDSAGGFL